MTGETNFAAVPTDAGVGVTLWRTSGQKTRPVVDIATPVTIESIRTDDGPPSRLSIGYFAVDETSPAEYLGTVGSLDVPGGQLTIRDRWMRLDSKRWQVDRTIRAVKAEGGLGLRILLPLSPIVSDRDTFTAFRYFAPAAMYDLNDLNGDHVEDYVDTQTLHYRDDRLSAMSVLAHHAGDALAVTLSRANIPTFDPTPKRRRGQTAFFQRTDIGSLGVSPDPTHKHGCLLTAAYPFVERDRSHALDLRTRTGWGAYWPVEIDDAITVSYIVGVSDSGTPHDALWALWSDRVADLAPVRVELPQPLDAVTSHRLDALVSYYAEDAATSAAGFVTNCHPQDGKQLGNVIQYGFTGQNVLNSYCLLRASRKRPDPDEDRRRALRVIDFFVADASGNAMGLAHSLYNLDRARYGSWWTGLLLPLAYAEPGDDLARLMGPLYEHLRPVIEALTGREGTYLRCVAEEYDALLRTYQLELQAGYAHRQWLAAAQRFAAFLEAAQEPDGSWYRAYDLQGAPFTDPDYWFGQTDVQRKSSTATVIPLLLRLYDITGEARWVEAAERACAFVYTTYVEGLKFNGGIHDSMYALPQLVDHESIIFAFRALLELYRTTNDPAILNQAMAAARIACTWTWLWDVPLPAESTLARHGFRSTGWTGCDTPGAGYVHPMGVIMVPDLVELARLSGDEPFLRVAQLVLNACNENVAVPGHDWGYARLGLQEEGLLISWCWAEDPIFTDTEFGGRLKGEGNKTCFPWISAVAIWAHQELLERYGTDDVYRAASSERRT